MADMRQQVLAIIGNHPKSDKKAIRTELWAFLKEQKISRHDYRLLILTVHSVLAEKGI